MEWKLTAKAELNCEIYKSRRKCWKNRDSFCHQSSPVSWELPVPVSCLEYCRSWKNTLEKFAVAVDTGGHSMGPLQDPVTWYGINYTGTSGTTVGLPKQRNSYQSSLTFLCFQNPTASFASQHNLFRTMWLDPAKGPFEFGMKGALVTVEIFVLCGWRFLNHFDIVSETPYRCDTAGCEL